MILSSSSREIEETMPVVEQRHNLYRELVLTAAEREFARKGFTETKMAAIAKAADLSLATVYKTFPGKVEIWDDLHTERVTALLAFVDERTTAIDSPLERLLRGIAAVAEFLIAHGTYLELNLGASGGWLTTGDSAGVQRTVWGSGLHTIAAGVEAARAVGELGDLRPGIATGMVVSALQVWLADWVESGRDRSSAAVAADLEAHLRILLTTSSPGRRS
jgi:AcrR family transcriptional regulator